jgi:putative transposase
LHRPRTDGRVPLRVPRTAESIPAARAKGATGIELRDNRCYGCQVAWLYNRERPHQALEGRCPAQLYRTSRRPYAGLSDLEYPFHDRTVTVTTCGRICIGRRKINLSQVFAGQNVGIKEVANKIWLVSFMHYDLGFFDHEAGRVECAPNPFGAKVLPMSPE